MFVKKTSNGSFVGNLSMKSGNGYFYDSFRMLDYDITITGEAQGASDGGQVDKADNPLRIKSKFATIKYKKLRKKPVTLAIRKVICFKNKGVGKRTYTLSSAKKGKKSFKRYFKVNPKTGRITVKKHLKKGTYKVTVKVKSGRQ